MKTARTDTGSTPALEVNGRVDPDTVVLQAGRAHRLRFLALHNSVPNLLITVTRRADSIPRSAVPDSLVLRWRPMAKDGADLPPAQRVPRPAIVAISMGETYDFELVIPRPGAYHVEMRGPGLGNLLVSRVPVRVEQR